MSYENNSFPLVTGTSFNQYGLRGTEDGVVSGGEVHGQGGGTVEKVVYITGDDFNGGTSFDTQLTALEGYILEYATFEVTEAFTLGNADNVFNIGTNGSESTNGVTIANPDVASVTQDTSGGGTWAAALAADAAIGVSVTGTTAAATAGVGKAKAVLRFTKI